MAGPGEATRSRLQTGHAAVMGRETDRTCRIAAQTERRTTTGQQRSLSPTGASRGAHQVIRIVGPLPKQVIAFKREQQVREIGMRERDGTGSPQFRHQGGVSCGCGVVSVPECAGGADGPRHFDGILY